MPSFHSTVFAMSSVGADLSVMPLRPVDAAFAIVSNSAADMDHRLGRNAAADEARAAQRVAFDERRIEAQLARADRRHIAARAAADDEDFGVDAFGHGKFR